jgi:MFS family permease
MVQTGWPIGALLAAAFVAVVTAIFGADSWRLAFLLATVPAVLVALLCRTLREPAIRAAATGPAAAQER